MNFYLAAYVPAHQQCVPSGTENDFVLYRRLLSEVLHGCLLATDGRVVRAGVSVT